MKFVNKYTGREITEREYYSMVLREMENAWYDQMIPEEREDFDNDFVKFVEQDFTNWSSMDNDFDCVEDD